MTEDAIVRLIVAVCSAFPALASAVLGVLRPDVAASVREQLTMARATMAAAPSPTVAVEALIAKHKAASVLADMANTSALTASEVQAVRLAIATLRPPVASPLAPPVLFAEPDGEGD